MENNNLDVNLIIQSFQEKVTQLTVELVVKDATIKQLLEQIKQLKKPNWQSPNSSEKTNEEIEYNNPEQEQKPRKGLI
jgi:peptidoglycan hydrolase CwlO-like protein